MHLRGVNSHRQQLNDKALAVDQWHGQRFANAESCDRRAGGCDDDDSKLWFLNDLEHAMQTDFLPARLSVLCLVVSGATP